jgi:2-polyprenyl-3-methyl-5-hydroxy-6-metoxy-1,4-benzoquinol methylase
MTGSTPVITTAHLTMGSAIDVLQGRLAGLNALSRAELENLHFDWEIACASGIKQSQRGSKERETLFTIAYEGLTQILREMRARDGRDLDAPMGCNLSCVDEVCQVLGPPPRTVLDVGCSTGLLVRAMLARGYDAYGIDVSAVLVSRAKQLIANSGPHLDDRLWLGDFVRYDFGSQTFDSILSNDVLEHVHPDEAGEFLTKCCTLIRPGGLLWLITPNRLTGPGDATTLKFPWGSPAVGLHLKEYTLGELSGMLRSAGFSSVKCRLFGSGKGRRATKPRVGYARAKRFAEAGLALIPIAVRKRVMGVLDYSLVIARR